MRRKLYPLLPMQRWLIDTHFEKAKSTMMNIGGLCKLDPSLDTKRFIDAVNDVLEYHDIFRCRLAIDPETGDICQHFDGKLSPVIYMRMNDEQLELQMKYLRQPFDLIEAPLYRIYVIETDNGNYCYSDFYHAMFDGLSTGFWFTRELDMRYRGREFKCPAESFAEYIRARQEISPSELERQGQYWHRMFDDFDPNKHLPPADRAGEETWVQETLTYTLENIRQDFFKGKKIAINTFFIAVTMLTIARLSGHPEAKMSWVHNGRITSTEQRMMGIMIEQYPIAWDFRCDCRVSEMLSGLNEEIDEGFKNRAGLRAAYENGLEDYCVSFILQKSTAARAGDFFKIGDAGMSTVSLPPNDVSAVENALDIEMDINDDGTFSLFLDYDASRYSARAMEKFSVLFDEISLAMQDADRSVSSILNAEGSTI